MYHGYVTCAFFFGVVGCYSSGGLMVYAENVDNNEKIVERSRLDSKKKKKIVVLGTGWAGTSFLKDMDISSYDVEVVSPRNYFAFTPLLPSVTCGTVEARSIVEPIRNIVKKVVHIIHYKHHSSKSMLFFIFTLSDALSHIYDFCVTEKLRC